MAVKKEITLKSLYYVPPHLESPYSCEARKVLDIATFGMYKADRMVKERWRSEYNDVDYSNLDILWSTFLSKSKCLRCDESSLVIKYQNPFCENCLQIIKIEEKRETIYFNSKIYYHRF